MYEQCGEALFVHSAPTDPAPIILMYEQCGEALFVHSTPTDPAPIILMYEQSTNEVTHSGLFVCGHAQEDHEHSAMNVPQSLLHLQWKVQLLIVASGRSEVRGHGTQSQVKLLLHVQCMLTVICSTPDILFSQWVQYQLNCRLVCGYFLSP